MNNSLSITGVAAVVAISSASLLTGFFATATVATDVNVGQADSVMRASTAEQHNVAHRAGSGNTEQAADARAMLRSFGQPGLQAMFDAHPEMAQRSDAGKWTGCAAFQSWKDAVDAIAKQRDAHLSRLYWHTDLNEAISDAQQRDVPILSLRLLGNLDDELSCANSRFFRSVLYANQTVAEKLRENYVLHWESVREVPRLTVDYGDGRRMERTITGNSMHLMLTPDGTLADALPGLCGPGAFQAWLNDASDIVASMTSREPWATPFAVTHRMKNAETMSAWRELNQQLSREQDRESAPHVAGNASLFTVHDDSVQLTLDPREVRDAPEIVEAAALPRGKRAIEIRPTHDLVLGNRPWPETSADDPIWEEIGASLLDECELDQTSRRMMWHQRFGEATDFTSEQQRQTMSVVFEQFEQLLAQDTAINRFLLQPQIREHMAQQQQSNIDSFVSWVYADVFHSPLDDPWMGLHDQTMYTAIAHEGIVNP